MRYIGNKTRLLDFIGDVLSEQNVRPGRAVDAFAGTASVGRYLKAAGFEVTSCDIMTYSYVFQKSYVELDRAPRFSKLEREYTWLCGVKGSTARIERVLRFLQCELPPRQSLISREFSTSITPLAAERMYFTTANAERIDAIRETIDDWRAGGLITASEGFLLLAVLLEAMDAVANTTGIYAAYVKSWQPNALRPMKLKNPPLVLGTGLKCVATQGDISQIVREIGRVQLLYLDPPYNSRQYSGYYHIPELVARGWSAETPELRGKTGLIPNGGQRSDWSSRSRCVDALNELLENANARYVLMSYNSEGIIPEEEIRRAFISRGIRGTYRVHERDYARYRADRDRAGRSYKASRVRERAYFVELKRR